MFKGVKIDDEYWMDQIKGYFFYIVSKKGLNTPKEKIDAIDKAKPLLLAYLLDKYKKNNKYSELDTKIKDDIDSAIEKVKSDIDYDPAKYKSPVSDDNNDENYNL